MTRKTVFAFALVCLTFVAGCGKSSSPTTPSTSTPTPPAAATKIVRLTGNMVFGNVNVGATASQILTVHNDGTGTMTMTGVQASQSILSSLTATPLTASISAGGSQDIAIKFSPASSLVFSGTISVTVDSTSGVNSIAFSGTGLTVQPAGPKTQFSDGQYLVNTDIVAGRYYNSPSNGCYFERESGLGGSLGEIIANDFIGFSAGQWIVDIAASDKAFKTQSGCNTWFSTPRRAALGTTIPPGMWLTGSQVTPGTYRNTPTATGCYWERLRGFGNSLGDVITNNFQADASAQLVTISAGDAGFDGDIDCGTWTLIQSAVAAGQPLSQSIKSPSDIQQHWMEARRKRGGR